MGGKRKEAFNMIGKFVTAKLLGKDDCRQGWVIDTNLFLVKGQSGETYLCEGEPVLVDNPPPNQSLGREGRLMPGGVPRYLRMYDNGGTTIDRYTIVFTGRYRHLTGGVFWHVGSSAAPFHPQGFYQHGESTDWQIDYPSYKHLGKRIQWKDLPEDVQKAALRDYKYLWSIGKENVGK